MKSWLEILATMFKKSEDDANYARYEVWWYSEEYDAYKVEREAIINGI